MKKVNCAVSYLTKYIDNPKKIQKVQCKFCIAECKQTTNYWIISNEVYCIKYATCK